MCFEGAVGVWVGVWDGILKLLNNSIGRRNDRTVDDGYLLDSTSTGAACGFSKKPVTPNTSAPLKHPNTHRVHPPPTCRMAPQRV